MYTGLHYKCTGCNEVFVDADFSCPCGAKDYEIEEVESFSSLDADAAARVEGLVNQAWAFLVKARGVQPMFESGVCDYELTESPGCLFELGYQKFRQAALMGHPGALYQLALMHSEGTGCEQSFRMAFHYFVAAAYGGEKWAGYNVGRCLVEGCGVEKDTANAIEWLKWSLCVPPSMLLLSKCFLEGDGVERSILEGIRYLREYGNLSDWKEVPGDNECCVVDDELLDFCKNRTEAADIALENLSAKDVDGILVLSLSEILYAVEHSTASCECRQKVVDELLLPRLGRLLAAGLKSPLNKAGFSMTQGCGGLVASEEIICEYSRKLIDVERLFASLHEQIDLDKTRSMQYLQLKKDN